MAQSPFGQLISVLQQDDSRIEGILTNVNQQAATLSLSNVILFGTEDRPVAKFVPYIHQEFPSITIQRSAVKTISKPTARTPPPPDPVPTPQPNTQQQNTQTKDTSDAKSDDDGGNEKNDKRKTNNTREFNQASLNIERTEPAQRSYDPSAGFFDATSDNTSRQAYSNMDTFGENLRPLDNQHNPRNNNRSHGHWGNRNNNPQGWGNRGGNNNNNNNNRGGNGNWGYRNNNNNNNNNEGWGYRNNGGDNHGNHNDSGRWGNKHGGGGGNRNNFKGSNNRRPNNRDD